ncbi:MAG TPA: hypothetical protein PKA64_01125 [Myxococcota bacterium]|nr:hypothetical protein [Myxococcota bacterium]
MMTARAFGWLLVGSSLAGCYSEGLDIQNLRGTVVVPREAATQTLRDPVTGDLHDVTDVALIGPVYIGVYPSVDRTLADFPLPELGPDGNSHPYTGTTIGDFRYACFEYFSCRLVSGRFTSYDAILDWYADVVGDPVVDSQGQPIATGAFIQQTCFDLLEVTSDDEIRIIASDRDGDGERTAADLDFVEDENGDFVAEFEMLRADFYPGMVAWAFMDKTSFFETEVPPPLHLQQAPYDTCSAQNGYFENTYDRNFRAGLQNAAILNVPEYFLQDGDRISTQEFEWTDPEQDAELVLDFEVGVDSINAAEGN